MPDRVRSTRVTGYPIGLAAARDGGVWAVAARGGAVHHLSVGPGSIRVDRSVSVGDIPLRAVDTSDGLWVSVFGAGVLRRLGHRPQRVPMLDEPEGLAVAEGSLWVVDQARSEVVEIPIPVGGPARVGRRVEVGIGPRLVHADRTGVWVSSYSAGTVSRVDLRRPVTRPVCEGPQGLALAGRLLWVACSAQDRLVGIDPRTLRVRLRLDGVDGVDAVTATEDRVLALLPDGPTLVVLDPEEGAERGRLRLADAPAVIDGNVDLLVHAGRAWASSPMTDEVLSVRLGDLP